MRKAFFITMLFILSGNATAEWVVVAEQEKGVAYIDLSTINKKGDTVKMWTMSNFKTAHKSTTGTYRSTKVQVEIDCNKYTSQMHAAFWYSENMAVGNANSSEDLTLIEWSPIISGTLMNSLWKIACKNQWRF